MDLLAPSHLIPILLIVALLFGAKRLPELAHGLGKSIREFKSAVSGEEHTETSPPPQQQNPPA